MTAISTLFCTGQIGLYSGSTSDAVSAMFAHIMQTQYMSPQLHTCRGNPRCKHRIEPVSIRLACTYCGTGTHDGAAKNGSRPDHVPTLQTGSPIILRGTHRPAPPVSGLSHPASPIEGTNETRLVHQLAPVAGPYQEPKKHFMH
jgi:hypothetical protein